MVNEFKEKWIKHQCEQLLEYGFAKKDLVAFKRIIKKEIEITQIIPSNFDFVLKKNRDLGSIQVKKFKFILDKFPNDAKEPFKIIEDYLIWIERGERPKALFALINNKNESIKLNNEDYWKLIIDTWIDCEAQTYGIDKMFWEDMLTKLKPIEKFKGTLKQVPDEFVAYRGGHIGGFSYSTNKKKAQWFQKRYGEEYKNETPLFKRITKRKEVLFYTNSRKEFEVVLNPSVVNINNVNI